MHSKLENRIKKSRVKKEVVTGLITHSKYAVLAFAALWMSARFNEGSRQFLVLAVIFGLKWVFESQRQIIQIFMQDGRG